LVKVTQGSAYVAHFVCDWDGQRRKRVANYGTVIHAGPHYERNVGTGADTSDVTTKLYWAQLGPFRRLIAVRKGANLSFVHHDHLGSVKAISGTAGGPYKYYPFGYAYQEVSNPPTDSLYTGQKRDSTGLYFYGARYYDSALGRFAQPDSIVPQPGNPQSLNRYSYCRNNPLKYIDPSGHREIIGDDDNGNYVYMPPPDVAVPSTPVSVPAPTPVPGVPSYYPPGWGRVAEPEAPPLPVPAPTPTSFPSFSPEEDEERIRTDSKIPYIDLSHRGVTVVNNAPGMLGDLIRTIGGGRENTITVNQYLIISSTKAPPEGPLMRHEMGHVEQARELGLFYQAAYIGLAIGTAIRAGPNQMHTFHPMEVDANIRAGLPAHWPD